MNKVFREKRFPCMPAYNHPTGTETRLMRGGPRRIVWDKIGSSLFQVEKGVGEEPVLVDPPIPTADATEGVPPGYTVLAGLRDGSVIRSRTTGLAGARDFRAHQAKGGTTSVSSNASLYWAPFTHSD
mgnify:CR=1 FL=1